MKFRLFAQCHRASGYIRIAAFLMPMTISGLSGTFLIASSGTGLAQTAGGLGLDALQQLQQQMQQRSGGALGEATLPTAGVQPNIVLQPAPPPTSLLPPQSRLERIMSARAGIVLHQFGYDQFGSSQSVLIPQTGAVQDDYVLGPGDQIVVDLRGQESAHFTVMVDRNGQVILPRLQPIPATGRSFGNFRADLQAAIHRAYVASDASVSVGQVRQISVLVSGEVNYPGQRLVTGLSSAVDAILISGGIKKTGSLRDIRIQRGGHEFGVDLYNLLTERGGISSLRLADGDRIIVPPLGPTVAVAGLVRRPGIFELAPHGGSIAASALLALAGGLEVRGRYRTTLLRIMTDGRAQMVDLPGQSGVVRDSEILFIQLGADQTTDQAQLSGNTGLAGNYAVTSGTTLSEVLRVPGAMGPSPYTLFGIIVRKDPRTLIRTLVPFTPAAVLTGHADEPVRSDDTIKVITVAEAQLLDFVVRSFLQKLAADEAAIRNPLGGGSADPTNPTNVGSVSSLPSDVPVQIDNIASVPASIQRNDILALLDIASPGTALARAQAQVRRRDFLSARQSAIAQQAASGVPGSQLPGNIGAGGAQGQGGAYGSDSDLSPLTFLPSDSYGPDDFGQDPTSLADQNNASRQSSLYALQSGQAQMSPNIGGGTNSLASSGNATNTGNIAGGQSQTVDDSENFINQSVLAHGRFALNREARTFGEFSRQLGTDPLVLVNFLASNRATLDGAVRGPGSYFVGPGASLDDVVQAAGGTVNWADESGIELITTTVDQRAGRAVTQRQLLPLHGDLLASYIVKPRDQFRFSQVFADAGIGTVTIQGEVHSPGAFQLTRGEHLSDLLMRSGGLTSTAYPYGTVFLRKSAAQTEHDGYVRAAKEIEDQLVVAMTRIGNDKIDPTTFASLQSFVQELRNQRALGRISVAADPSVLASNPRLDPLLEPGDVVYIPQRASTIAVLGQVMQPGSFAYEPGQSLEAYVDRAGGYATTADNSQTFVVLPDGSARRMEKSLFGFEGTSLPPGSAIVVPRDVTPFDTRQLILDISSIFSQFAISAASIAVLSQNR